MTLGCAVAEIGDVYFAALEQGDDAMMLERGADLNDLMIKLLMKLESSSEGALGYIAELNTGRVVQRHRKSSVVA
jgi:hypothetical protein